MNIDRKAAARLTDNARSHRTECILAWVKGHPEEYSMLKGLTIAGCMQSVADADVIGAAYDAKMLAARMDELNGL